MDSYCSADVTPGGGLFQSFSAAEEMQTLLGLLNSRYNVKHIDLKELKAFDSPHTHSL